MNLNIHASTLNLLFRTKHITLPVFQRKYCWTTKQFKLFWKDLNDLSGSFKKQKHHIGRFTCFENEDEIIVIDGQQRITTVMIIIMSIRDAFIRINTVQKNRKIERMIDKMNSILFNTDSHGPPPMESDEKSDSVLDIEEGDRLQYIRFLPTYLDREPFYNLVLRNSAYSEYLSFCKMNHFPADSDSKCPLKSSVDTTKLVSPNSISPSPDSVSCTQSKVNVINIYESKKYFDARVAALCRNGSINRLGVLYNDLLTRFTFVHNGIPHQYWDKGFFLYQWLFEKQFLAATLLQNNRPGEHHLPCELLKNYILSFFITLDMEQQERVYVQWNGMEKKFDSMKEFNAFLVEKVESEKPGEFWVYREMANVIEKRLENIEESEYPNEVQQYLDELDAEIDALRHKENGQEVDTEDDIKQNEDVDADEVDSREQVNGSANAHNEIVVIDRSSGRKDEWERVREMAQQRQLSIVQESSESNDNEIPVSSDV